MNDDALKQLWKGQRIEALPALPDEAQIAAMKTRMKGFDKTISWRDYGEVAACILIIGWFGWDLLFRNNSTLTQAGCVVLIVSAAFIAWKLIWSKRRLPKTEPSAPIFDAVKVELQKVENQIGLLKSVAWWYLLPLLVGVMMCHWGGPGSVPSKLIYSACVLALYVFIYWLNQRAVKNNLLPLKRELASLLHSVETGEPLDQTQLANLRRIAFSMTAAGQVKPVEFKVAFWQLAIYGVPGIVGIWFFCMLARTEGNIARIFIPQHLLWGVLSFFGGLIYTWLIQKTVKRAVGISALGIHLQNGMNLILWNEIKEVRPFRFLNIQNLWLIKESGEKTRMHWTPLERHSDVKAAVEKFAPANHPIRQHLSLLRSKPSKKNILAKTIMLVSGLLLAGSMGYLIIQFRPSEPRVPEFDDVSAFADSDIARVDAWLQEQVDLAKYPSLSVAIVRDGRIVYERAFGFENIKAGRKATLETSYHVASVTKAFTASLAVLLHHRGVIDLDQPVVKYLPNDVSISTRPEIGATITLRQLASHTSGLPRGVPGAVQSVEGRYQLEPERLYTHLARVKLEFDPGTEELYSNLGFGLLGHALERAAGKPFDRLLQEMLCEPLQLERTAINVDDKLRVATGYSGGILRLETEHSYRKRLSPSGGLIASAPDLAQFLAAQMKPGLFSSEMLEQLHTLTKLSDGSAARTALGWGVRNRESVGRILKKNGGRNNAGAWIGFAPDHGVGVAVVANCGEPDVDPIGYWLLERSVPGRSIRHPGGGLVPPPATNYSDPTSQMLETIRVKHNLPALAAAVVVDGKIVVTNAVGFRKNGGAEQVTVDDKFHLGSVTKSMTTTVAAMLVEQGKISWTTTIGEAFPELKSAIHPDYLGVTLEQLLSHRSGAPGDAPGDLWRKAWAAKGTAAAQRLAFSKEILARKPEAKPGTKHIYSNQGYTIAGVMLEKAAGKTWEDLLRSMLFEPLGMTTAGFGAPASLNKVDQPWGHTKTLRSRIEAVSPGPRADNPLAISPAGAVHCSMGDLAKYAAFHMAGERGESKLLKADSFKKLHTAVADNDDYALGWMVRKRPWANGRALMHNGSNTMFYVVVWMAPDKNCAVIVAANIGVDEAFGGCDEVAGKLIKQSFPK